MEQEMRYIWEIWREGSFSKAAEKLYLSQPALSMAVGKVERALGAPLFDRSHRPPTLTPTGEIYIETARETLRLESEMKRRIADIRELNAGHVRMGGSHYVNGYILPDVLASFGRAYPKIELELLEHSSAHLAHLLEQREIDLAFSANAALVKEYEHVPAFRDRLLLAVPEKLAPEAAAAAALSAGQIAAGAHRSPDCPEVDLGIFRDLEFILLGSGETLRERAMSFFQDAGITPRVRISLEVGQHVTAYRLAGSGMGAVFVSDRLVAAAPEKRLRYYKLARCAIERQFFILLPPRAYVPAAVRAFVEWFGKAIED